MENSETGLSRQSFVLMLMRGAGLGNHKAFLGREASKGIFAVAGGGGSDGGSSVVSVRRRGGE